MDEIAMANQDVDAVVEVHKDVVEVVHTLEQVVCVDGGSRVERSRYRCSSSPFMSAAQRARAHTGS